MSKTITIYASCLEEVTKKLESIARKAFRYGCPIAYEAREPYPKTVTVYEAPEYVGNGQYRQNHYNVTIEAVDLLIDAESLICASGYTALAKLEHFENGNIVTRLDGKEGIPEGWRSLTPYCEHCRSSRQRNVTYLVQHFDGSVKQVGSSCLHDYTGIDPRAATAFAELYDAIGEDEACGENYREERERGTRLYEVRDVIAYACDCIRAKGYHTKDSTDATAEEVRKDVVECRREYSREAGRRADEIIRWLTSPENGSTWDLICDCIPLAKQGWCKLTHIGRLAYLPVAYEKEIERERREADREARRAQAAEESKYIGNIGERLTLSLRSAEFVTSWEGFFGYTYLYRFTDEDGNVLVWFASGSQEVKGATKLTGTVKEHSERDGVKQTVVTRCRVA